MLSSKLLSEVLGRKIKEGFNKNDRILIEGNNVTFAYAGEDMWSDINIHELAHKCKEWANKYNFNKVQVVDPQVKLLSYVDRFGGHCRIKLFPAQLDATAMSFHEKTEPEAIFKACEWILEQKDKS